MGSYEGTIDILAGELSRIEATFRSLTEQEWAASTLLVPVDPELPHWTVFELAGHFDISIGLTRMLLDGRGDLQPARDRTSFFINPRSETGPVVYGYAYTMVQGKTPADMPGVLAETFGQTIEMCRAVPAGTVGPGYFAPMQVDEFVASRVVEARGARTRPHPGAEPGSDRHARGARADRSDPGRPAGPAYRGPPTR